MKIVVIISILFMTALKGLSQVNHIAILVSAPESYVKSYFDSLCSLRPNRNSKIDRNVADNGDLLLQVIFPVDDESFFRASGIMCKFKRVNGIEICYAEIVYGVNMEFAEYQLIHVKDNFKEVGDGVWEKPFGNGLAFKTTATFTRKKDVGYFMRYDLVYTK